MSNLRQDIDLLMQAPMLIKVAREIVKILPKGKDRDQVIRQVQDIKSKLIALDVHLQDIEWSLTEKQLNKKIEQQNKSDSV